MSITWSHWWPSRRRHRTPGPLLDELVQRLTGVLGPDLRAIVLYGSAASGHFHPRTSNLNLLIVTASQTAGQRERLRPFARAWLRHGVGLPLFLAEAEFREWSRSFPVEFLDIQAHHRVLAGPDIIATITVDMARLQWQCEAELRGKLLRLRQTAVADPPAAELRRILERSLTSLFPLLRGLLRLRGNAAPLKREALVPAMAQALGMSTQAFDGVLQLKTHSKRLSRAALRELLAQHLAALEQLIVEADRFGPPPHA